MHQLLLQAVILGSGGADSADSPEAATPRGKSPIVSKDIARSWNWKFPCLGICYSPHMPRRGAPHGQGPDSLETPWCDVPATANTDRSFSTLGLEQCLHRISTPETYEIFSNLEPQSRH